MKRVTWILFLLVCFTLSAYADDQEHHHEALTTGELGTVHYPVYCDASVQKPFERGIALMHSFWYEEAEKQFLQIAEHDPDCGTAHWGVDMSLWHQLWHQPDAHVIKRGWNHVRKAAKTQGKP